MKIAWYPKTLLLAIVLLACFAVALNVAIDFRRGIAMGVVALIVYICLDFMLTLNSGQWWRHRSQR